MNDCGLNLVNKGRKSIMPAGCGDPGFLFCVGLGAMLAGIPVNELIYTQYTHLYCEVGMPGT